MKVKELDLDTGVAPCFKQPELHDDFLFKAVFSNKDLCRQFLVKILNLDVRDIKYIQDLDSDGRPIYVESINVEETLLKDPRKVAESHGVRVDLFVTLGNGTVLNIEMQNKTQVDLPKRVRYYQSAIDRYTLKTGQEYSSLTDSIIVFVCNYDPFGKGDAMYVRKSFMQPSFTVGDAVYNDGSSFICLNTHYTETGLESEELVDLLNLIREYKRGDFMNTQFGKDVASEINKYREMPAFGGAFSSYRTHADDLRAEGRAEGRAEEREISRLRVSYNMAIKLVKRGMNVNDVIESSAITPDEFKSLYSKFGMSEIPDDYDSKEKL